MLSTVRGSGASVGEGPRSTPEGLDWAAWTAIPLVVALRSKAEVRWVEAGVPIARVKDDSPLWDVSMPGRVGGSM